ncbi:MAG: HAMP domain-containing protein [Gammaproteobacteria bacterium]|nr:HAMP domain-containing protein [Gammaproteobacteria bacterium]MYF30641.1 HAMP domain-containing protein [Gammaproteobacteria bacterium]MYK46712.1 HAMP domain-containing protein [Gammaproteobacteria bacterium]
MLLPWVRFRLRTVLIVLSLFVLVLPVAGIQVLRLYESALVRQTESALVAHTDFIAAAFRHRFRAATADLELHSRPLANADYDAGQRRRAVLDLANADVGAPFPDGRQGPVGDDVAVRVGLDVAPILTDVQTRADIRVTDHQGVVVATNGEGRGTDLSTVGEVAGALAGFELSRLRRLPGAERTSFTAFVRGAAIRVIVTGPIVLDGRVVGTVVAMQTPSTIVGALETKRFLLLQAAGLLFAVVVGTAIFATRTLARPIRRLVRSAERVAAGDAVEIDVERYRTKELAQLAASVAAMATSLQQRTRYVRDLARSISHEFKTPLAAMSGTLEVLGDHLDDMTPEERRHFIDNLAGDVARLESLTQRLLELARADMRDQAKGESTVAAAVGDATHFGSCVEVRLRGDLSLVLPIDEASMQAVLKILLDNAREHGAETLTIDVGTHGDATEVCITDDGHGIAPGDAARVFEPFFTTRREQGGTGLGLPIAKALLGNAGGTIDYLPPNPSQIGARFRIRFRRQ